MSIPNERPLPVGRETTDTLKGWVMVILTFGLVTLYASALLGWIRPITDFTLLARLEPMVFIVVGYYLGRLPSQHHERSLKDEISRQSQKADAAQQLKERAFREREALEEKVRNAKSVLVSSLPDPKTPGSLGKRSADPGETTGGNGRCPIDAAVSILDS